MLEVVNGCFGYDNNIVITNVNFKLLKNETIGIIGKSGSGKSTILNTIYGEIPLVSGKIANSYSSISVIFQHDGLFPWLTIRENLVLTIDTSDIAIEEVCDSLDLKNEVDQYVSKLSRGQKQRVQIARMLLSNAYLVIMDEPTSSLDLVNKSQFIELINRYMTDEQSLIIVSHDIEEIMMLSDKIIVLKDGKQTTLLNNIDKEKRSYIDKEYINKSNLLRELIIDA